MMNSIIGIYQLVFTPYQIRNMVGKNVENPINLAIRGFRSAFPELTATQ